MSTPAFEIPCQPGAEDRAAILARISNMEESFRRAIRVAGQKSNFAPELSALVMRRTAFDDSTFDYRYDPSAQPPDLESIAFLVP